MPPKLSDLLQEIGRAGRKGGKAYWLLYLSLPVLNQSLRLACSGAAADDHRAQQRLDAVQNVLSAVLLPGCRRSRLYKGMIGPAPCPSCRSCDRCCSTLFATQALARTPPFDLTPASGAVCLRVEKASRPSTLSEAAKFNHLPHPFTGDYQRSILIHLMLAHQALRLQAPGERATATLRVDQEAANQASLCNAQVPLMAVSPWVRTPAGTSAAVLRKEIKALSAAHDDISTHLRLVQQESDNILRSLREKQVALLREERRAAGREDTTSRRLSTAFSTAQEFEPMDED